MNKKCTLLAAAFMVASAFTASAANVVTDGPASAGWTVGNYYFLQTGTTNYLALSGERADSVIIKADADFTNMSKAALDSALWQITSVPGETAGNVYQFTNKKTKAVLSFSTSSKANSVLASGVDKWVFTQNNTISANNGGDVMTFGMDAADDNKLVFGASPVNFTVVAPEKAMKLKATDLGDGFSVFQLLFDGDFEKDVFKDKDIIARESATPEFMTLQVRGEESFPNGVKKFFGVDTLKTDIANATGAYGAKLVLDSVYTVNDKHTVANADYQLFKFKIDLKNDSLAMFVRKAPSVNDEITTAVDYPQVVYASLANTKVLTVGSTTPAQGVAPRITVAKGTPTTIATGSGVYFLKSASVGGQYAGKYIWDAANYKIEKTSADAPSAYLPDGQWYIKEDAGKYSIVDRKSNTSLLDKGEIFAVKDMANTYTFGGSADSITVVVPKTSVPLSDKYLGSRHFTDAEIANNGYALNMASAIADNLYVVTADSVLQAKQSTVADAIAFKLIADTTVAVAGATSLGDTLYQSSYMLKERFSLDSVAYYTSKKGLKLSSGTDTALVFVFHTAATGGKYSISAHGENKELYNVSADGASSNLTLVAGSDIAYFNFMPVAAPTYGSVSDGHKLFMFNAKYLAMNPLNFWAEMKNEGQPIVKADYIMDDFAFWVAKAKASTDAKPLYLISKVDPAAEIKDNTAPRYYMVSFADSTGAKYELNGASRVGFVSRDTIATMENSPAVFALKTTEDGSYLLENQRDLSNNKKNLYVANSNGFLVMSAVGAPFAIESTSGPVDNEEINATEIVVTASVGTVTVQNAAGKRVALSNILGQSVGTYQVTSDRFTVPASRGVVIVAIEGETAQKVLVK